MGILNDANDLANIASDQSSLHNFIKSALDFVLKNNLDGLNLYWKNINWNIYNNLSAKENILLLVKELSKSFRSNNLLLMSAFAEPTVDYEKIYDYVKLSQYLDFMHFNKLKQIDDIIKLGVSPSKIIMEFNTKTLSDRLGQFTLTDLNSFMDSLKVFLKYNEICDLLSNNKVIYKVYDPNVEQIVARYIDTANEMHTIQFESTRTLANKTRHAIKRNLGGVSITSIDADDSKGRCKIEQDTFDDFKLNSKVDVNIPIRRDVTFPLLRTINQAIVLTLEEIGQIPIRSKAANKSSTMITWDTILANLIDSL